MKRPRFKSRFSAKEKHEYKKVKIQFYKTNQANPETDLTTGWKFEPSVHILYSLVYKQKFGIDNIN